MTKSATNGVLALAIAALLTIAACSDPATSPAASPAVTTPHASATSPGTAVPPTTTRADPRLARGGAAVSEFSHVVDLLAVDRQRSLDQLTTVSRGQTLETWRALLTDQRRRGYKQIGDVSIGSATPKLAGDGKVTVDACLDVSKTDLVDKHGKSVVAKSRPPRVNYHFVTEQGKDGKFYVIQDKAVGTC